MPPPYTQVQNVDIRNQGRGVHEREISGLEKLRGQLPRDWYGFTNLELTIGPGQSREIDIVMVIEDRILLVDLKHWNGRITAEDGRWFNDDLDMGPSPVEKIRSSARKVAEILKAHLRDRAKAPGGVRLNYPFVQGLVLQTGRGTLNEIAENERANAFVIDDFIRFIVDPKLRRTRLSEAFTDPYNPLTTKDSRWRFILERFFNASGGHFRPGQRRYGSYRATSDYPTFTHRSKVFIEFDVEDENAGRAAGLLRRWDFSKADGRFQTENGRQEIAGREKTVIAYLNDRSPTAEAQILQPKAEDIERSVGYWEVFDKRRRLKRLSDFVLTESRHISTGNRIELARQLLASVKVLHDLDAAHLDIGQHSVWLEAPSTVRLSHLLAARFPEFKTLGESRYRFLSTVDSPEDVLGEASDPKRKDSFLLGVAIHQLIFDRPPAQRQPGDPPEWDETVDPTGLFRHLHPWFATALAWAPQSRFADAAAMLLSFNEATSDAPSSKAVLEGLERFRHWTTQRQIYSNLPSLKDIKSDDRVDIWLSKYEGRDVIVKMWKREAWGDQQSEAPRLLAFLEKAEAIRQSPPPACATIRKVCWIPDAVVILQDFVTGETLEEALLNAEAFETPGSALGFVKALAERVTALHQSGLAHGDLKPSNIMMDGGPTFEPTIIDLLDLTAAADGELVTTAYAPPMGGDRFARDRFAVTKIAEEVLSARGPAEVSAASIALAIETCRTGPPTNATLLPLIEVLNLLLTAPQEPEPPTILISVKGAQTGTLHSDEGYFGFRMHPERPILLVRGASEEIGLHLDDRHQPIAGWRSEIEQRRISTISRFEFATIKMKIEVKSSTANDFAELLPILNEPTFRAALKARPLHGELPSGSAEDAVEDKVPEGDDAEDMIAEAVLAEPPDTSVDVPTLWRSLMAAEENLSTEGITLGDSSYRTDRRRHVAPFELEEGTFDFNREDFVFVERLDRKSNWRDLGLLDVTAATPSFVVIDASRRFPHARGALIAEGSRLRFRSHWETISRTRRGAATDRMLSRQSTIRDLIDLFDARKDREPSSIDVKESAADFKKMYSLNDVQAQAFKELVSLRPLGLLQGPPGTGKTYFIGAFIHYALTSGLAKNVLLASQAHEAVNNAAEAVLKLFDPSAGRPSIVRVGQEGSVSERLLPYHSWRVETEFKDRFNSNLKERLRVIGNSLGLPMSLCDELIYLEQTIRPVCERIESLKDEDATSMKERMSGLMQTLATMLGKIGISLAADLAEGEDDILERVVADVMKAHNSSNADSVARFRAAAQIARDFIGAVSTQERSFETFLAGTRQIVAGTCVGLGRSSLGLTSTPFDLVVVDEAARCTASELAVPIQSGRWIVLVGDQAQLEPQHKKEIVDTVARQAKISRKEIKRSDFERVFASKYGVTSGRQLTQQYRMLSPIGRIVSKAFYPKALSHERTVPEVDIDSLPASLASIVTWISTDLAGERGRQKRDPLGTPSLVNSLEVGVIIDLLKSWDSHVPFRTYIERSDIRRPPIGVICMYAAQRDLLRNKMRVSGLSDAMKSSIVIGTVDSYQGKENLIVILSLVRNNDEGPKEAGRDTIRQGFMARPNRVNVAFSRAMDRLVVVGARNGWPSGGPMHRVAVAFNQELHPKTDSQEPDPRNACLIENAGIGQESLDNGGDVNQSRKKRKS